MFLCWRYLSANVAGIDVATREVFYGNAKSLFDGMHSYRTRGPFGRYRDLLAVTYQANVTHLLDDRTLFIAKTVVDTATRERYQARSWREDPRHNTFTERFDF